ncbi:MAG: OpgC domain-containing protein [Terriglobales bacterium]
MRDWRVDTLRGYFLVCITIDHLYNPLRWFTQYTFGYASSPDGFIFLSGLVSSWVYLKVSARYGSAAMRDKVFRRAIVIYLTHITIVTLSGLAALFPSFDVQKVPSVLQAFAAGALLKNHGEIEKILPLYCILLAVTPLVFREFKAGRAWLVGALSASLWVAAQCGLGGSSAFTLHPAGFFNLFAWQAYFVAGQYLGFRGVQFGECGLKKSTRWQLLCLAVAIPLLIDRHLALLGRHPLLAFSSQPNHNPVRFLDAACLGYLVWCVPRTVDLKLMKNGFCRFINFLGGHSLQVVAFSLLLTSIEKHAMKGFSGEARLIVAVLNVASLWIPAKIHQLWREGVFSRASTKAPRDRAQAVS